MKLRALIVDDEHSGRVALKLSIDNTFYYLFEVVKTSSSFAEAKTILENESFHICFLDIDLNGKSGFDLLPFIPKSTNIVFVTAYSEYAIKAIRERAFDYLLKPINPLELNNCIHRLENEKHGNNWSNNFVLVKHQGATVPILINDIVYIEGDGPYSLVVMTNGMQYTTAKTLKSIIGVLNSNFIRVHKSYLVNKMMIRSYSSQTLTTKFNQCLPVSRIGSKELSQHF